MPQSKLPRDARLRAIIDAPLRALADHVHNFYAALGIWTVSGLVLAVLGTWGFAELAEHVRAGTTQLFDDRVLLWLGAHRVAWLDASLLEITALGTGLVVVVVAGTAALFLSLVGQRWPALFLLVATAGSLLLDTILKAYFDRPRPQVIAWGTHAISSSFPSGHAMSAVAVYGTLALLAMRLEPARWMRWVTAVVATIVIVLIAISRLYLGVHYPSDVFGGAIIGTAWAGFCLAGLEAVRVFEARLHPARDTAAAAASATPGSRD